MTQQKHERHEHQEGCAQTKGEGSYLIHEPLATKENLIFFSDMLRTGTPPRRADLVDLFSLPGNKSQGRTQQPPLAHIKQEVAARLVNVSGLLSQGGLLHPTEHSCISHRTAPS